MKIYQCIAMHLQNGFNALAKEYDSHLKFTVEDMYDYVEKSKNFEVIKGIVSYSSEDILPVAGLNVFKANADVTFTCIKEYADTVSDFIELYTQQNKGITPTIGDYVAIPTFSTPTRSEIIMVGELGECIEVSFYCSYVLIKNGVLANQVKFMLDGRDMVVTKFEIGKTRGCPADNEENSETVLSSSQTQAIAFNFTVILTSDFDDLIDEIMAQNMLDKIHSLTVTGLNSKSHDYKVLMASGTLSGEAGGVVAGVIAFSISR